jgi:hypothetical protein
VRCGWYRIGVVYTILDMNGFLICWRHNFEHMRRTIVMNHNLWCSGYTWQAGVTRRYLCSLLQFTVPNLTTVGNCNSERKSSMCVCSQASSWSAEET